MGLDVYLYRHEDLEREKAIEAEFEERAEKWDAENLPELYADWTAEDKDRREEFRIVLAEELNTSTWGSPLNMSEGIEIPSKTDPGHLFKIGYWRSSYNSGGINNILRKMGLMDLYGIVPEAQGDAYHIQPDWAGVRDRALETLEGYEAMVLADGGNDTTKWDADALRIVVETAVYVLSQPEEEQKKLWLHWSG